MLIPEPRSLTRIVYDLAIREAVTSVAKQDLAAALHWYEEKWRLQDKARQEAADSPPHPVLEHASNGNKLAQSPLPQSS